MENNVVLSDESDQSKWTISDDESYIINTQLVGIGIPPNLYQLAVSGNIAVDGDLAVSTDVNITEFMMLDSGDGFNRMLS